LQVSFAINVICCKSDFGPRCVQERGTTQVVDGSALFGDRDRHMDRRGDRYEEPHSRFNDHKDSRLKDLSMGYGVGHGNMDSIRHPKCDEAAAQAQAAARLASEPHAVPSRERADRLGDGHAEGHGDNGDLDADGPPGVGLVIGSDLVNPDPVSANIRWDHGNPLASTKFDMLVF